MWSNFLLYQLFSCCLQVLYFCPGFKTGVKHLYNIISKKKESLKDEGEQKAEKVTYLTTHSFTCTFGSEAAGWECNENLTQFNSKNLTNRSFAVLFSTVMHTIM